jgi:hypothetical protein
LGKKREFRESEIEIVSNGEKVIKKYKPDNFSGEYFRKKYFRELYAYEYFNSKKVDFVPHLLSYNKLEYSLTIENIQGNTLQELIDGGNFNEQEIIDGLIVVDKYLYLNKINYMNSSVTDILVSSNENRIYIVDFEYTYLNEYYQQILYDCLFGSRMMRIKNKINRDRFLKTLRENKNKFESYYYRKSKNIMLSALGIKRKKERST